MKNFLNKQIVLLMLLFAFVGIPLVAQKQAKIAVGEVAPDFKVTLNDGVEVSLSDFRGKPVVLHFWGTWCPPCVREMPHINKFAKESGKDYPILAVAVNDSVKAVNSYFKKNKFSVKSGVDVKDVIASLYGVRSVPRSILIDDKGVILKIIGGAMSEKMFQELPAQIDSLMANED